MKKKHIHFIGVKGVGIAPLAVIAKEAGFTVTGCDIAEEFITDIQLKKAGIEPLIGFSKDHLNGVDIVITTGAHGGYDNPEVKVAKLLSMDVITQGEAAGLFMSGAFFNRSLTGISVAGSHGKTTTTAFIATMLSHAMKDPSYLVGTSELLPLGSSGHFGHGSYFVAEADEYATEPQHDKTPKFLWQHPEIGVITNIELDHTDLYPTLEDISNAFLQFANGIESGGVLVACGDDREVRKIMNFMQTRVITYGFLEGNDFRISKVSHSGEQTFFWVESNGTDLGEFSIKVPGDHNALNALATLVVGLELGLSLDVIKKGLMEFRGTKRRLEFRGLLPSGARVFDDYAHHPTEIKKTLKGLEDRYPKSEIVCIFQPHTYSRTKALFDDFSKAFDGAKEVVITDIYASLREEKDETISSEMLVKKLIESGIKARHISSVDEVHTLLSEDPYSSKTIVVIMGAGNIYKALDNLTLSDKV